MHWDILEAGEMHHNPAKNVLWVRAPAGEIASRSGRAKADVEALIESARRKLYEARKQRPMPFVDRTLYTNWNALCISAYLQAARALGTQPEWSAEMRAAAQFALRSLDRLLTAAHDTERGLSHVIAYDNGTAGAQVSGVLDNYAFTALACLDAYESTSEPRYFEQARQVAGQMIEHFYDESGGGFDDTAHDSREGALGVLAARRKPFQDAPTPAGNSAAAIALLQTARPHRRGALSRAGAQDAGALCRSSGAVRHLRRDLWDCGAVAGASSCPGGGGGRRPRSRRSGGNGAACLRPEQDRAASSARPA